MTRFEKHFNMIQVDPFSAREILEERQQELNRLKNKRDCCKNGFRWQCITQELEQLEKEYQFLDALI
ncbi:hypothetical protein H1220_04345 [Carnobacteriaceae bacterium zg-84]|nr:hypothetical protein [Granulicatella sp. zg-84]QMI86581.1 hypothetical protein H1220_04345 [Carnobacteriaceae bacterium zg-84]